MSPLPDSPRREGEPSAEEREARIRELRAKRKARAKKIAVRSAATFGIVGVLVVGLLWWLLTTVAGRDVLLAQIKARLPDNATFDWQRAEGPASGPLTLHGVRFTWDTLTFTSQRITLDPALRPLLGRRLRLDAMQVQGATLDLPESDEPFKLPAWPEVLPQVNPPLAIQADTIEIDGLRITRQQAPVIDIRRVRGGLLAERGRLHMEKVGVDTDRGDFVMHGDYVPSENYRMDVVATAVIPMEGSRVPLRLGLVAKGDLDALNVGLAGAAPAPLRATLELRGANEPRWQLRAQTSGLDLGALSGAPTPDAPVWIANLRADGVGGRMMLSGEATQGDTRIAIRPSKLTLDEQVLAFAPLDLDVLGGRVRVRGRGDFGDRLNTRVDYAVFARGLQWGEGDSTIRGDAEFGIAGTQLDWAVVGRTRLARGGREAALDLTGVGRRAQLTVQRMTARMPTGTLSANGRVTWRPELAWNLHAQLDGFDPGYFAPGWNGQLHGPITTTGKQPAGGELVARVAFPRLGGSLRGRRVGGSGTVDMVGDRTSGTVALVVDRGRAVVQGQVETVPQLAWNATARLDDFDPSFVVAGWPGAVDAQLTTRGRRLPAPPGRTGDLEARIDLPRIGGSLRGRALSGTGNAVLRGDDIEGRLQLAAGASRLDARGRIGDRLDIDARLSPVNLQDLLPDARGSFRGTVRVTGPRDAPDIAADLTGRDATYADYRIAALTARGRLPWSARSAPGALTVRGSGLQLGLPFEALNVDARGAVEALRLTADARGDFGAIALAGSTRKQNADWLATLGTLRIAPTRGAAWSLTQPAALRFGDGRFALARTCLASAGGGSLCANADWPRRGVEVTGRGVPLVLLASYLPEQAGTERAWQPRGELNVDASIRPVGNAWRGQATITSPAGGFKLEQSHRAELVSYSNLRLAGTFDPQRVDFDLSAALDGGGRVRADIATGFAPHAPLAGSVDLDTRELTFVELFSPDIVDPRGQLTANLRLSGTRAVPLLGGQARLSNFSTEVPALGIELTEGAATLVAREDGSARIDGRVRSGEGFLNIDGDLAWRRTGAPLLLNLRGQNVEVANTRQLRAVVDPNMQVRVLPAEPITISGEVAVPSGLVQLERLEQRVKASPDVVVLDPAEAVATQKPQTPLVLDFTLVAGDDVRLQGFGLDGTVQGRMQVRTRPEVGS